MLKECSQYQKKCEHMELTLDEEQSDKMINIVDIINQDAIYTLNKVIIEAEPHGNTIREIWKDDVRSSQDQFKKDQDVNGIGLGQICSVHAFIFISSSSSDRGKRQQVECNYHPYRYGVFSM